MAQKAQKTTKKTAAPFSYEPKKAKREIKRPDSLRGQAEALLLKGAKIAAVEELVAASDKRRKGKKPTASVERRATSGGFFLGALGGPLKRSLQLVEPPSDFVWNLRVADYIAA